MITPEDRTFLNSQAITDEILDRTGVSSVLHPGDCPAELQWAVHKAGTGLLFWWWTGPETAVPQFRPTVPWNDPHDGRPVKYVFPVGSGSFTAMFRLPATDEAPVLVPEGTKQCLAALSWAPEDWGIYGVPGCQNWKGTDLSWADGRRIIVLFDKDVSTNRDVYDAAGQFAEALKIDGGADRVVFAKLVNARSKDGLDDVLGARPEDRRRGYLERICADGSAQEKLGRPPSRSRTNPYFGKDGGLLTRTTVDAVLDGQPAALAKGSMVALYRDGVYRLDRGSDPVIASVTKLLGEEYRSTWRKTIEEALVGVLEDQGRRLLESQTDPLLNTANGMLDLRTGELSPHHPDHLSSVQIPVCWDPDAKAPFYEEWISQYAPGQVDDLEESLAVMLDPSRIPSKAVFLYGPSKSGKSTIIRVATAIAGEHNTSGVSLHQLEEDHFMSANVYNRMLNSSADLSAKHLSDMSLFKKMTGGDLIQANRKYGQQFEFTNQALFVFSANKIPTVNESSNAYLNRIKPFLFPNSYEGREDPTIEDRLLAELPGILVRWVAAWQRFNHRGTYMPSHPVVMERFASHSDRVRLWVTQAARVHPEAVGTLVGREGGALKSELYAAFKLWLDKEGGAVAMKRGDFLARLESLQGVGGVRLRHHSKNVGLSVEVLPEEEWGTEASYSDMVDVLSNQDGQIGHDHGPGVGSVEVAYKGLWLAQSEQDDLHLSPTHSSNGATPTLHTPPGDKPSVTESYGSNPFDQESE